MCKIAIASDHRGFLAKGIIAKFLAAQDWVLELDDQGPSFGNSSVDYPLYAAPVAQRVSEGRVDRGILVCGTGMGMCIAANKFPGVRAVVAVTTEQVVMSRAHNDANVLCLPCDLPVPLLPIATWLRTDFNEDERHVRRIKQIKNIETTV